MESQRKLLDPDLLLSVPRKFSCTVPSQHSERGGLLWHKLKARGQPVTDQNPPDYGQINLFLFMCGLAAWFVAVVKAE